MHKIHEQALQEIAAENFEAAVAAEKARIRAANRRPLWLRLLKKLFPYTITITKDTP